MAYPRDLKENADTPVDYDRIGVEEIVRNAGELSRQGEFKKALKIMKGLIDKLEGQEKAGRFVDDDAREYRFFDNLFEAILYNEAFKPTKEVASLPENYAEAYYVYGALLFELKRFNDARAALKKASKLNPVHTGILFELAEISKISKEWDEFLSITNRCFEYAYSRKALARCYRNTGFYHIEQRNYTMAMVLYYISLAFDNDNKTAHSELKYILTQTGKQTEPPDPGKAEALFQEHNIPAHASAMVLNIALGVADKASKDRQYALAKSFYEIFYELTWDDKVKKIIESMP